MLFFFRLSYFRNHKSGLELIRYLWENYSFDVCAAYNKGKNALHHVVFALVMLFIMLGFRDIDVFKKHQVEISCVDVSATGKKGRNAIHAAMSVLILLMFLSIWLTLAFHTSMVDVSTTNYRQRNAQIALQFGMLQSVRSECSDQVLGGGLPCRRCFLN